MKQSSSGYFIPRLAIVILLNALGLTSEILEPDGALYATISRYMAESNDYLNIWADGHDWLDKPHLPFWLSALSMEVFGVSAFAYKLPAFLVWLLGLRFTYLLGKSIYGEQVAELAVIVLGLALHGALAIMDVRAEPYLTTFCVGGVYYLWQMQQKSGWKPLLLASICTAAALMTKGLFALMLIGGGQLIYWIAERKWKEFIRPKWYLFLLLTFLFITPELYALWVQFDSHPEKVVFGQTGVSGIRFFFWDSQFGRFFKTGPITNGTGSGDRSFFIHTTAWAFLPWSLFLFAYVGRLLLRKTRLIGRREWVVIGGCLLMFLLFSLSKFQLPHYVVILFPFYALMTARYLVLLYESRQPGWPLWLMRGLSIVVLLLVTLLVVMAAVGGGTTAIALVLMILIAGWFWVSKADYGIHQLLRQGLVFGAALYVFLNLFFYPWLMQWQAGMYMGKFLKAQQSTAPLGMYAENSYTVEFYAPQKRVERLADPTSVAAFLNRPGALLFTTKQAAQAIEASGQPLEILMERPFFHVTMLEAGFLNRKTRSQAETPMVLVRKTQK